MKSKLIIYLAFLGLIGFFSSCEKDGDKVVLLTDPIKPVVQTLPDLTLQRDNGATVLEFICTPANPGFQASATNFLEACVSGNNFVDVITIFSGSDLSSVKTTVGDLNNLMLTKLTAGVATSVDFRIRAVLTQDAGTGYTPITIISEVKTATVTAYGPPTLACTTAGTLQGVISPSDNKIYKGWIYTDGTPFTFTNTDDNKVYGGDIGLGVLTENGPAIALEAGAYQITVDMTNMSNITITSADVTIGIIGDAVGGWGSDTKMIWDFSDKTWNIDKDVIAGGIKFRTHGTWNIVNVAYRPNDHNLNNLYQSNGTLEGVSIEANLGDSQNIDDVAAGSYHIKLFLVTSPWSARAVFTPAK
jgi:starch-binding outer membrane protein SusE/F